MAINYFAPRQLSAVEYGGIPDIGEAIRSGFKTAREASDTAFKPHQLSAELLKAQLSNKMNAPKAEHAEELTLADLANKQAQTRLYGAQTDKASRPDTLKGKLAQLYQLRDSLPPGSPDLPDIEQAIKNTVAGSNGITVIDPKTGLPLVQIGGPAGGSGKGGVKTFMTPEGTITQSATTPVATGLQNRIVGAEIVKPYIKNIIKTLPQFQSGWTRLQSNVEGMANNWLKTDFDLPSQLQEGKSSVVLAAEGMVKQFGLHATTHALKKMESILTPSEGESKEGYERRAQRQVLHFAKSEKKAQELAGRGVPLTQAPQQKVNPNMSLHLPALGETESAPKPNRQARAGMFWGIAKDQRTGDPTLIEIPNHEKSVFLEDPENKLG